MSIRYFISHRLGVDKAIFYTIFGRGLHIATAFFTVFFISKYLNPDEQGYYYTFGSIVAVQVFFELGLTGIITQFVAHEACYLSLEGEEVIGEQRYISRLSSLLHFCFKWYSIFAILIVIVLVIVGIIFFSQFEEKPVVWKLPWTLLVIGTALNFLIAPLNSYIEGLGYVEKIAKIRFVQQLLYPIIVWGGLCLGSKLFVSGAYSIINVFVFISLLVKTSPFLYIKKIWKAQIVNIISYKNEILPLQWKIALSWISGYFIFQLFNPVLFATEGASVAGQMGMSMSAILAVNTLALSWISTKVPFLSAYIAKKDYVNLENLFSRTSRQLLLIGSFLYVVFLLVIFVLQHFDIMPFGIPVGERFLPIIPLSLMVWSMWTMLPINCWATYLRCHKKEPLVINSVVMGVICCISTPLFGYLYGLYGICISFSCLRVVSVIWTYMVYKIKKEEYQK